MGNLDEHSAFCERKIEAGNDNATAFCGLPVAIDGADQGESMTFLEDSKSFFTLYHAGKVNITLHMVSFSFLFWIDFKEHASCAHWVVCFR